EREGAASMYKSLLSPEELNELLSAEQVSELAAASEQQGESLNVLPPSQQEYLKRIQQLELQMQQLLNRVSLLESQLKEYSSAGADIASSRQHEEEWSLASNTRSSLNESLGPAAQSTVASTASIEARSPSPSTPVAKDPEPIRLSRV